MKDSIYFISAFLIGGGAILQSALNAQLKTSLSTTPLIAAFASVLVSTIFLGIIILVNQQVMPTSNALSTTSAYKWTGGIIGALFVLGIVFVAPKIGLANTFGFVVAGQMIISLTLDHYGALGMKESPISITKIIAAMLIIVGVVLLGQARK